MQLISLDQIFKILKPGVPLPFGVRDASGRLLLAKGLTINDPARLMSLLNRGMYVDAEDVKQQGVTPRAGSARAAEEPVYSVRRFPNLWVTLLGRLGQLLRIPGEPGFLQSIQEIAARIVDFPESLNDQILFLILRHDHGRFECYAEAHALHVACLCHLVSRRLDWPDERRLSLVGAALTMNLSMIGQQARMAGQTVPPSPAQRKVIHDHPQASAILLRLAGLRDEVWLTTVEQHHECPDGSGYPLGLTEPQEASQVLRLLDIFSAKHSSRAGRGKLPAQKVARDLYAQSGGSPVVGALIKECGIYPPGTYVKLANGEIGVVTQRGANAKEPLVMAITNAHGEPLGKPVHRDTATPGRAIVETVSEGAVKVQVSAQQLFE